MVGAQFARRRTSFADICVVIGLGSLMGQAIAALWRRRWTMLALTAAWLLLDGPLLAYLKIYQPLFGLTAVGWFNDAVVEPGAAYEAFRFLIWILHEFLRDAIRAVFVILVLRSLLRPPPGERSRHVSAIQPIGLVLLFEVALTMLLYPIDYALTQAASNEWPDRLTGSMLSQWGQGILFVCYSLAMAKLCFVYPNATMGLGLRPRQSWSETRGLAFRLFLVFLAAVVPFLILRSVFVSFVVARASEFDSHQLLTIAIVMSESVQAVPAGVLTLALIAVAFVTVTGRPTDAIPGAGRTSRQLAEAFE